MTSSRLKSHIKAISLLLIFFCIGGLLSHCVLGLMLHSTPQEQSHQLATLAEKAEPPALDVPQPDSTLLVSVSLPAPPPARSKSENAAKISAKPLTPLAPEPVPQSSAEPQSEAEPEVLLGESEVIDTEDQALIEQGLSLLRNARQDVPQIQIQLPIDTEHSEQVINTLRACMGVRLGKLNQQGEILMQENSGQAVSPFVRVVEGKLSRQEQQLAEQWQREPGAMVRFYPEAADAKVLGGLLRLVQGPLSYKKISADYHIQNGELSLVNIKINGKESQTRLRLAKLC